jgi:NADH dehydrogenase/NADH:ubiquinone oxidoreductase subunit G
MYQASQKRFIYQERRPVKKHVQHDTVVYEPEKCIKCGICVRMTAKYGEKLGLTFIGRGFDVRVGIPFNEELDRSLEKTARKVAEACPTGALSLKEPEKQQP